MEDYITIGNDSEVYVLDSLIQVQSLDNIFIQVGLTVVYAVIFLICCGGNLAVILVVTLRWKARLLSKFYLGNMAIANLFVAVFCIPQSLASYLLERWIFGELLCKMFHCVTSLCHTASILILLVVSIERYIVLAFNGRQVLTVWRIQVITLLIWLLSAGVSLPHFFYCGVVNIPLDEKGTMREVCVPIKSIFNSATAETIYLVVLYILPLALMSALYLRIGVRFRKSENKRKELDREGLQSKPPLERNIDGVQGTRTRSPNDASGTLLASNAFFAVLSTCHGQMVGVNTSEIVKFQRVERLYHHSKASLGRPKSTYTRQFQFPKNFWRFMAGHFAQNSRQPNRTSFKNQSKCIQPANENQRNQLKLSRQRSRKRAGLVRMLTSIIITFALLNLPFHIRKFCINFLPPSDLSGYVNKIISLAAIVLLYVNCAVNPVLYILKSSRFRSSLRDLIRKSSGACSRSSVSV